MAVKKTRRDLQHHEHFMSRCLQLARKGAGYVSPNPMVGSVLVVDNRIVGEGFHQRFGGPHAEVNAIACVDGEALLPRSTLYVNLEPCSHHGKTPPCSDLIIQKKIPRVVVACRDPHKKVAGKGIAKLRKAGVEVIEGILEKEALKLNEAFVKSHVKNMPFVALKLAQTLDGKIATVTGRSKWITGKEARRHVHSLRSCYDAVLTGSATVLADDPRLTVRHTMGRNPLRVVLDRTLQLPHTAKIFNGDAPTLLFTSVGSSDTMKLDLLQKNGVEVVHINEKRNGLDLEEVLSVLYAKGILSVFVEAGSRLSASLLRSMLVDKVYIYIAPKLFGGDGLDSFAPLDVHTPDKAFHFHFEAPFFFGEDILLEAYMQ